MIDLSKVKKNRRGDRVIEVRDTGYGLEYCCKSISKRFHIISCAYDGRYGLSENQMDLVEEIPEVEVDFWVNIYHGDDVFGAVQDTKQEADRNSLADRIACINIKRTVKHGEGL